MKISVHPLVEHEISDAVGWYDEQAEGLGDDFLTKLLDVKALLTEHPTRHAFWLGSKTIRCAKLKRFPYSILFCTYPAEIRILCLRHDKRHPNYGFSRR